MSPRQRRSCIAVAIAVVIAVTFIATTVVIAIVNAAGVSVSTDVGDGYTQVAGTPPPRHQIQPRQRRPRRRR